MQARKPGMDMLKRILFTALAWAVFFMPGPGCAPALHTYEFATPTVSYYDVRVDTSGLPTREVAAGYLEKTINATEYGLSLGELVGTRKKMFEYGDIYVRITKRVTKQFLKSDTIYVVEASSCCEPLSQSGRFSESYKNRYYFPLDDAQNVYVALVALGASPCMRGDGN